MEWAQIPPSYKHDEKLEFIGPKWDPNKNRRKIVKPFLIPYPVFVRFHFYPADTKMIGYNTGTGVRQDKIFLSCF
jgi:hypothetical protein